MSYEYVQSGLEELYETWLLETHPEDFRCKDEYVDLLSDLHRHEEFVEHLKTYLEEYE